MRMEENYKENNTGKTLEEKCECLMNIVVETRKQFGKLCVDYNRKAALVENEMLKLKLKNISTSRFKVKSKPQINTDKMSKELDDCTNDIISSQQRFEKLRQGVSDMQTIVLQLKNDAFGKKLRRQITADALLVEAKRKNK